MTICRCLADHSPNPMVFHKHHIVPKAWGGKDGNNIVYLCPTSHENVHKLLNEYVRAGGQPSWEIRRRYGFWVRDLAAWAWEYRPSDKPPYTTVGG